MDSIVKHQHRVSLQKTTLRKCLIVLGFSDEEMRYGKSFLGILPAWTGEEMNLFDLATKKWKDLSIRHHESKGGNQKVLAEINLAYSEAKKRILKHRNVKVCSVCKKEIIQPYKRVACSPECWNKRHYQLRKRRIRLMPPDKKKNYWENEYIRWKKSRAKLKQGQTTCQTTTK